MKTLLKTIFNQKSTTGLTDGTVLETETNLALHTLKRSLPIPSSIIEVDATRGKVNIQGMELTLPHTAIGDGDNIPVVKARADKLSLEAEKYAVILAASRELLRASSFENILNAQLNEKLHNLAGTVLFSKLDATVTTNAATLGDALDAMNSDSGIIVAKPSVVIALIGKLGGATMIGNYHIVSSSLIQDNKLRVLSDGSLYLSMTLGAPELSSDAALVMMDNPKNPTKYDGTEKISSIFQEDLTAFKFHLYMDVVAAAGGYNVADAI